MTQHPGTLPSNDLPGLPDGYQARPPVHDDAPAIVEVFRAAEIAVLGASDMTLTDFLGDWEGVDLEHDCVAVTGPNGAVAAYADRDHRSDTVSSLYAYVHPAHEGRGLGTFLAAWGERRAREAMAAADPGARVVMRQYLHERAERAQSLVRERGFRPVRETFVMEIDLAGPPAVPDLPAGLTVRAYVPGQDDQAAFEAFEEAFADLWGRPPGTLDKFLSKTRRPYFDPATWLLALDGDEIAGMVLADTIEGKGWVDTVAVRRPWRGRGLAYALLLRAFANYWERGVTNAGLSVDAQSLTGATRLYERAGMRVKERYTLFELEIRPGVDQEPAAG